MTFPNRLLLADSQLKTIRLASSVFYLFSTEICGFCYINSPPLSAVSKDPQAQRLTRINSFPRSCSPKEQLKNDFPPKRSARPSCHVRTAALMTKRAKHLPALLWSPRHGEGPRGTLSSDVGHEQHLTQLCGDPHTTSACRSRTAHCWCVRPFKRVPSAHTRRRNANTNR